MITVIVFTLVGIGLLLAFTRLLLGPTVADRVVSLDTFNVIVIGIIVLLSMLFERAFYLDIAIIYAILAFLETIVFARYLEGRYGNH